MQFALDSVAFELFGSLSPFELMINYPVTGVVLSRLQTATMTTTRTPVLIVHMLRLFI